MRTPQQLRLVSRITLALALPLALSGKGRAQDTLLQDLLPGSSSSSPRDLTYVKELDLTFFTAERPSLNRELWVTDNGLLGARVLDVGPGPADPEGLTAIGAGAARYQGAVLAFTARRPTGPGRGLYLSDGSGTPTEITIPGDLDVEPDSIVDGGNALSPWTQVIWFQTDAGSSQKTLWEYRRDRRTGVAEPLRSLATGRLLEVVNVAGIPYWTQVQPSDVVEVWRGLGSSRIRIGTYRGAGELHPAAPYLFFAASAMDRSTGFELYRTDLTRATATLVQDLEPGPTGSQPNQLTTLAGHVYFAATTSATGSELYRVRIDATSAPSLAADVVPGIIGSEPRDLTPAPFRYLQGGDAGSLLYFTAYTPSTGRELRVLDVFATSAPSVRLVRDLTPGPGNTDIIFPMHYGSGEVLVFQASIGTGVNREFWCSDGTTAGTRRVADIEPGERSSFPGQWSQHGADLLFAARQTGRGRELHRLEHGQFGVTPPVLAKFGVGGVGAGGKRPQIFPLSVPRPDGTFSLQLNNAPATAPAVLLLTPGHGTFPFALTGDYGCTAHLNATGLSVGVSTTTNTTGFGTVNLNAALTGVPAGTSLTAQFVVFDSAGCFASALNPSDAMRIAIGTRR